MNKTTSLLLAVIAALCFVLGGAIQSRAQNKTFAGVIPFVSSSDRIGFFDQNSGRIYIYDNNVSQCLFQGQIKELGQAIQTIQAKNISSSNPEAL